MAKGAYIGVNGAARKVKSEYVGVNGAARKVKKSYVGVNGVARESWSEESTFECYVRVKVTSREGESYAEATLTFSLVRGEWVSDTTPLTPTASGAAYLGDCKIHFGSTAIWERVSSFTLYNEGAGETALLSRGGYGEYSGCPSYWFSLNSTTLLYGKIVLN